LPGSFSDPGGNISAEGCELRADPSGLSTSVQRVNSCGQFVAEPAGSKAEMSQLNCPTECDGKELRSMTDDIANADQRKALKERWKVSGQKRGRPGKRTVAPADGIAALLAASGEEIRFLQTGLAIANSKLENYARLCDLFLDDATFLQINAGISFISFEKAVVNWQHWMSKKGRLRLGIVGLCKEDLGSPSPDTDDFLLSF
ncbi:unnamed protein product, partial [Protopolystoma xenopodis]